MQHWATKKRRVRDVPHDGMPAVLEISQHRYRCSRCKKAAMQVLPELGDRSLTRRLADRLIELGRRRPHDEVAKQLGLPRSTVSFACTQHAQQQDLQLLGKRISEIDHVAFSWIENLGTTSGRGRGAHAFVVANAMANTLVDVVDVPAALTGGVNPAAEAYLRHRFAARGALRQALIPPWLSLRSALRQLHPDCQVVLDPYAFLGVVDESVANLVALSRSTAAPGSLRYITHDAQVFASPRARLSTEALSKLELWRKKAPLHAQAYQLKEAAYALYGDASASGSWIGALLAKARAVQQPQVLHKLIWLLSEWAEELQAYHLCTTSCRQVADGLNNLRWNIPAMQLRPSFGLARTRLLYDTADDETDARFGPPLTSLTPQTISAGAAGL